MNCWEVQWAIKYGIKKAGAPLGIHINYAIIALRASVGSLASIPPRLFWDIAA